MKTYKGINYDVVGLGNYYSEKEVEKFEERMKKVINIIVKYNFEGEYGKVIYVIFRLPLEKVEEVDVIFAMNSYGCAGLEMISMYVKDIIADKSFDSIDG